LLPCRLDTDPADRRGVADCPGVVLNDKGRPYRVVPTYGSEYGVFTGVTVEERQRVSRERM
jgi:hypothetical protein